MSAVSQWPIAGDLVITGLGQLGTVVDTYETRSGLCAHVSVGGRVIGWHVWALSAVSS